MTISLFRPEELPHPVRYDLLFERLPHLEEERAGTGRPPFSSDTLLKGLIYKAIRGIRHLTELAFELHNNSAIRPILGLSLYKSGPSVERFSRFLRSADNQILQSVRKKLLLELIQEKVIEGTSISLDSCPIPAQVKQNNLKTSVKNRFDKTQIVPGDPQARLGVIIHFPNPFQKKVTYFWGYRNHIVSDNASELPLGEITQPANVSEVNLALDLLKEVSDSLKLSPQTVTADAHYDAENILKFIFEQMRAIPIIPRNPGSAQGENYTIIKGKIHCLAGLEMYRKGKMHVKKAGISYCQYCCPINYGKKQTEHMFCPILHEKFIKGKGCNVLIRLSPSVREKIPYDTEYFKEEYHKRTSVERIFSRLLAIAMQNPTVTGLNAVSNYATIAHIAVLLVALAAYQSGNRDEIRFVKSFVPNFL
jgi:transposase